MANNEKVGPEVYIEYYDKDKVKVNERVRVDGRRSIWGVQHWAQAEAYRVATQHREKPSIFQPQTRCFARIVKVTEVKDVYLSDYFPLMNNLNDDK